MSLSEEQQFFRDYIKREEVIFKNKARQKFYMTVWRGITKKKPCEICGDLKVHAHHEDYNKPFNVIWLCKKHHAELHRKKD